MNTPTVWVALDNRNYLQWFVHEPVWKIFELDLSDGTVYYSWWRSEEDYYACGELPSHYAATLGLKPGQKVECKLFAIGAFKNHEPD